MCREYSEKMFYTLLEMKTFLEHIFVEQFELRKIYWQELHQ